LAEIDELRQKLTNIRVKSQQIADNVDVSYTDGEMTLTEIGSLLADIKSATDGGFGGLGYNVLFKNGNIDYYLVSVPQGSSISAPVEPTSPSGVSVFGGWEVGGNILVFPYYPQSDVIANARWWEYDFIATTVGSNKEVICTIDGRTFYKQYDGECYCAVGKKSGLTGPLLVAHNMNDVIFGWGSNYVSSDKTSFQYNEETWYVGGQNYWMGNYDDTSGSNRMTITGTDLVQMAKDLLDAIYS